MAKDVFAVLFHVEANKLPTVLEVLKGHAKLVNVTNVPEEEKADDTPPKKDFHYAGGKRNKGISGQDLALKILRNGGSPKVMTIADLSKGFVEAGFAANSANPIIRTLVRLEQVRNLGNGQYCLPGVVIHKGASA